MTATLKRIRKSMRADHNGTRSTLLLHLVVYHGTGIVSLDRIPITQRGDNMEAGLLGASEVALATINEFRKQIKQEQARWTRKSRRG